VVAERWRPGLGAAAVADLVEAAGLEVLPLDQAQARRAVEAFMRFGKGRHPAALNFGDCLVYAASACTGEPLLFKGEDFSRTDVSIVERPA